MTVVVTLEDFRPSARYDGEPWTAARIYEAPASSGPWTLLETIALSPIDADPENPAYRNFTTDLGTADEQWYQIVFVDADLSTGQPTFPIQNVPDDRPVYGTVSELARMLTIRSPSVEQETALQRVLSAAAGEINSEIDLDSETSLSEWQRDLATDVNLRRAAELWNIKELQFGVLIGTELGPVHIARNSWDKYAYDLAPLKDQWGLA